MGRLERTRIGEVIDGKYRIVDVTGEGGMGTVYRAVHVKIHRQVAIKVLKPGLADDDAMIERFEREAQAAGRIGSEHIVEVQDVGTLDSGERFMIMEHLSGETLSARLRRIKRMLPEQMFPIAIQMLEGLDAAHEAGIVHRDLKPANVFLVNDRKGYDDFVKIVDFGVSKFLDVSEGDGVTRTGTIVGTPHYMAPEQTRSAREVTHQSDVYAVGAIVYRALSGRPPYRGDTIHELLVQLISEEPPKLSELVPGIEPSVARIVHKALARDLSERYASAAEFADALRAWLDEAGIEVGARGGNDMFISGSRPRPSQPAAPSHPAAPSQRAISSAPPSDEDHATVPSGPSVLGVVASVSPPSETVAASADTAMTTLVMRLRRNSRIGYAVGAAGVVIALAIALPATLGDSEPPAPAATTSAVTTAPAAPSGDPAPKAPAPEAAPAETPAEPPAPSSPAPSARAATTASGAVSATAPAIRPQPASTPPKPAPRRPPPPKPEREIRTDL